MIFGLRLNILNISIFFTCLIPFSLAIGPLITEILFISIFILNFKHIYRDRHKYFKNFFIYWFLAFYIYLLLNSIILNFNYFSSFEEYINDQRSIVFFFRYIFYFISIWYLLDKAENLKKLLFISIFITLLIIGIDAFYQYFTNENILGYSKIQPHRLSGIFKDELILGSYLLRVYFIFISLFLFFKNIKYKNNLYLFITINLIFGVLIYLSGERSAFILFLLSNVLFFIILKSFKLNAFIKFSSLLTGILIVVSFTDTNIQQRMVFTTLDGLYDNKNKKIYFFTKAHHGHYMSAKLMFRENLTFGVGTKRFKIECKKSIYHHYTNQCANHPHNYYMQLFSETGVFGASFVILIYLIIIKNLYSYFKEKNNYDYFYILLIGLFIMYWPIAAHGNFFNNWLIMNSIFSLSLFFHFSYKKLLYK